MEPYHEPTLTKTKIVATVGPACRTADQLRELAAAGVDVFRLNFAHADHDVMVDVVAAVRTIASELDRPIGLLGDLSGPKIRLGEVPPEGLLVQQGERYRFVREEDPDDASALTTSYPGLVDDLDVGTRVLLADGMVTLRVVEKGPHEAVCEVEQPGRLLSRQGVNIPRTRLRLPSLTEKDHRDLAWALEQGIDFIGLSFVRRAEDVRELRQRITEAAPAHPPFIVAKIEKPEAVDDLESILEETDVVMVARGDLGVEVDIARVPAIQKQIIRACNEHRVPVITATQMLESMQQSELPTRAEASDVANAVLDGTDAVMLSGETAVGRHPARVVAMMSRIIREVEPLVVSKKDLPLGRRTRNTATELTRAVTLGAMYAAEHLDARLLVVLTRSGATASAVSELRSGVPILALTDVPRTGQWLALAWGVRPVVTDRCRESPQELLEFAVDWAQQRGLIQSGDRVVLVGTTDWSQSGKDLMLVKAAP